MNIFKKNASITDERHSADLITGLCEKYYHHLKNKDTVSKLCFEERVSIAHDLISEAKEHEIYFYRRIIEDYPDGSSAVLNVSEHQMINLASNDYLGFTRHQAVIEAGTEAIRNFGAATGSVPMLSGTTLLHKELEAALADFTGYESCLTYSSCFAANYGLLASLLTFSDAAVLDIYVHGSIIDGCCNTNIFYFRHNDPVSLKRALEKASVYKNKLVVVDGVYSMDGDIVVLEEIANITRDNGGWLMIDESHAIGVIGKNGSGTNSYFNWAYKADIITGSMGKGLGGAGGFVAGSEALISFMELTSRPFLFSTSLPQNIVAQLIKAIKLMQSDASLLEKLWSNINLFANGLKNIGFRKDHAQCAILPLVIPDEVKLLKFCQVLQDHGIFVNPIFFPIVPRRMARIRISITSALPKSALEFALESIETAGHHLNIL